MSQEAKRRRVADEWVTFYSKSKKQELRLLSNFADLPVECDGLTFPTGEHRFHHAKFTLVAGTHAKDSPRARQLLEYAFRFTSGAVNAFSKDGPSAKRAGGKGGLPSTSQELRQYNSRELQGKMIEVQRSIVELKARNERVRVVLAGLGEGVRLLHFERGSLAHNPSFWGGFINKQSGIMCGESMLGRLWDEQRDRLCDDEQKDTLDGNSELRK